MTEIARKTGLSRATVNNSFRLAEQFGIIVATHTATYAERGGRPGKRWKVIVDEVVLLDVVIEKDHAMKIMNKDQVPAEAVAAFQGKDLSDSKPGGYCVAMTANEGRWTVAGFWRVR